MAADPTQADFWNTRYEARRMPWDQGAVPAALTRYLAAHPGRGASVLIPGCGSGYEIAAFAAAGFEVTAIDFSTAAVARARAVLPSRLADRIIEGDFFSYDFAAAPFDVVYERTFLCALPSEVWPALVRRIAALLKPGGVLAGIFFFGAKNDGPPYGFALSEADGLFKGQFVTVDDRPIPATESLPLFAGHERWQERRRRTEADDANKR